MFYDGEDAIEEFNMTVPQAGRIMGGVDEFFQRDTTSGSYYPLVDALVSVIALTNASGAITTQYTYDPFGNTTVSGTTVDNPFNYTGRENQGNWLYYYRARYYQPRIGRFISEDPLGFGGGDASFYTYASNSPTNDVDPFGLSDFYVLIWNSGGLSPGHAEMTEANGQAIASQFPYPHSLVGDNIFYGSDDTLQKEGRLPTLAFKIHIPDDKDVALRAMAAQQRGRKLWQWGPGLDLMRDSTKCVYAVAKSLKSAGIPVSTPMFPGSLGQQLTNLSHQSGHDWSVTPVPLNKVPGLPPKL